MDGCYKCMKGLLIAFNTLVLLIGGAVLGLGVFTTVTQYGSSEISAVVDDTLYKAGTHLLIGVGAATVIVSFLGCAGAAFENRCLLGFYFFIMLILSLLFLAITIIGFVFRGRLADQIEFDIEDSLLRSYGDDESFTQSWDKLQAELKCCGFKGDVFSNTSWAIYRQSAWFSNQKGQPGVTAVPYSCCKPDADLMACVDTVGLIPREGPPATDNTKNNPSLFTEGCWGKLKGNIDDNAMIIAGVAIGSLCVMVLGTLFSICLCIQIGRQGYLV